MQTAQLAVAKASHGSQQDPPLSRLRTTRAPQAAMNLCFLFLLFFWAGGEKGGGGLGSRA